MEENLKKYIDELISEIQNELDETTVTGNIDGYQTPHAFSDKGSSDKNRKKKMAKRIGYTLAGKVDESFMSDLDIIKKGSKDITDFVKRVLSDKQYKEVRTDKEFHKYLKSFYNESVSESVNEAKTYKKGDKLKIKLRNGKKFDVVFDTYSNTKGIAYGKFKVDGEVATKPFSLSSIVESIVTEGKDEVTPKQLANLQRDIKKINPKIKVYISNHPVTKGKLQIELGSDHPSNQGDDREITKINTLLKKHTGDWRTGTMFTESKVSINEQTDYKFLTQTILDAKPKYNVYYNSGHNKVNIGGVGYDGGDLVKNFNQKPGSSSKIKNNFYHANQDPQKTKKEVEKLSNGKIKVDIQKGYGGKPVAVYIMKESVNEGVLDIFKNEFKIALNFIKKTFKGSGVKISVKHLVPDIKHTDKYIEVLGANGNSIRIQVSAYQTTSSKKLPASSPVFPEFTDNEYGGSWSVRVYKKDSRGEMDTTKISSKKNQEYRVSIKSKRDAKKWALGELTKYISSHKDILNKFITEPISESVNEAKIKRPVNRWLELKNDETMHPHKKMAMGLKELKYQLGETQKFFNWYNKIKTMNELDSSDYWKRTQNHIYKIKERLVNIARTIQEIEK